MSHAVLTITSRLRIRLGHTSWSPAPALYTHYDLTHTNRFVTQIPERTIDIKTLMVLEGGKYVVQKTVKQESVSQRVYEKFNIYRSEPALSEI